MNFYWLGSDSQPYSWKELLKIFEIDDECFLVNFKLSTLERAVIETTEKGIFWFNFQRYVSPPYLHVFTGFESSTKKLDELDPLLNVILNECEKKEERIIAIFENNHLKYIHKIEIDLKNISPF